MRVIITFNYRSHLPNLAIVSQGGGFACRAKELCISNGVRRTRRGFTLIELLVVISIVVLLISILLPVVGKARRIAKRIPCMNNMRTMGTSFQIYTNDSKGILPWDCYAEGDRPIRHVGPWEDSMQWFNVAPTYAGQPSYNEQQLADIAGTTRLPNWRNSGLFVCPCSDPPGGVSGTGDLVTDGYFMLWGCDVTGTIPVRRKTFWSYGYNTQLDQGVEDRHINDRVLMPITMFPQPTATVVLIEKLMRPDEYKPYFNSDVGQAQVSWKEFTTRHEGGGFLLFLDNHVNFFQRSEILGAPNAPSDYNQPGRLVWNPGAPSI